MNSKTVLITGASSGIGKALALAYAEMGYLVYAGGRNQQRLDELVLENANIKPLVCELTNKKALIAVSGDLPQLDILILNAGNCEYINDAVNFDSDLFARVITTNLISVGYCLEAWLKLVKPGGQLVLTSSSAQFLPLPRAEAYGASKAGLSYLAKTLSIDLQNSHIDVSLIHPGFVATPLTDKNDFPMPSIISTAQAADYIVEGINKRKAEINFPKHFTYLMKLISLLPFSIWKKLATRMNK